MVARNRKSFKKKPNIKIDIWLENKIETKNSTNKYADWVRSETVTKWLKERLKQDYNRKKHLTLAILIDDNPSLYACTKFSKMSPIGLIKYHLIFDPNSKSLDLYAKSNFFDSMRSLKFQENY